MNMQQMMRQAQKMQKELQKAQQEIAEMTFEGTAGGGMVTAVARGDKSIESLTINPDVVDPEDVEMLEDLLIAALNEAMRKIDEEIKKLQDKFADLIVKEDGIIEEGNTVVIDFKGTGRICSKSHEKIFF